MTPTTLTPAELAVYTAAFGAAFVGAWPADFDAAWRAVDVDEDADRQAMIAVTRAYCMGRAGAIAEQAVLAFREVHK